LQILCNVQNTLFYHNVCLHLFMCSLVYLSPCCHKNFMTPNSQIKRTLKTCLILISTKIQAFGIHLNHNASSITFSQILMYPNYDIQIFKNLNCKVLNLTYLMCLKPFHFQNKIWDMETWSTFWNAKKWASNKHTR
jgi:hypothetical protein